MIRNNQAFLDYHAHPTSRALVELLRIHQHRVYNLCFQVLRHAQDAEDAAQEVLLEILGGVGSIQDPGAFHVWLYRVCLHTALNHKERRATRLAVALRRSEMNSPGSPEGRNDIREEILKALAQLDDRSRALVIEHYLEKRTLQELGHREGVSAVAVWKRIEKAKDRLRRMLVGTGCVVLAPNMTQALESVTPVTAPADLLGHSILAKAALVAAGGITVGAKSALSAASMVLALLFLGLGLAGGLLFRRSPENADSAKVRELELKVTQLSADLAAAKGASPSPQAMSGPRVGTPTETPAGESLAPAEQLKLRLARFKAFRQKANEDRKANLRKYGSSDFFVQEGWASREAQDRWRFSNRDELAGLREVILAEPEIFVAFVKDAANADCMFDLLDLTLAKLANPYGGGYHGQKFGDFPRPLMDGLQEALLAGGVETQREILKFLYQISDQPLAYLDGYRLLMSSGEADVRVEAAKVLCQDPRMGAQDFQAVQAMALSTPYKDHRGSLVEAMTLSSSSEAEGWFVSQMGSTQDDEVAGMMINAMGRRAMFGLSKTESVDPLVRAMMRLMERPQNDVNEWNILKTAAYLPAGRIPGILDRFAAMATDESAKKAGARLAELVRDGERKPLTLFSVVQTAQEMSYRKR